MKKLTLILLFCFTSICYSQIDNKTIYPIKEDVQTLDGIIKAYYEVISGPAQQPRNWERDKSLHVPNALVFITGEGKANKPYIITQTLIEYHADFGVPQEGFWEYEIHRKTESFGNITHVWSTYETRTIKNGPVTARGINSIQLYNDGKRYWIISWGFDSERPNNRIPAKYN